MAEKYTLTKRPGKPGKLKKVIDLISGKRKWPESRFEEGYYRGIKKAGVLPGAGSEFFREKETKLDERKKFILGKGERFSTKLDRDRRKDAYVKDKWDYEEENLDWVVDTAIEAGRGILTLVNMQRG